MNKANLSGLTEDCQHSLKSTQQIWRRSSEDCDKAAANLDGVGQRDGHRQRQSLWNRHHQHCHADDEELDKILDVDRGALGYPGAALNPKGVNHKVEDEDDDGHSRHDQAWVESGERGEVRHKHSQGCIRCGVLV